MSAVVNCAAYTDGRRVADVGIEEISEVLKQSDRFVWIGLHEPDEELLRRVQLKFGLHDLAIEDAHRAHQRPKLELYGDSLFVVLRTARMNAESHCIDFGETHIFLGVRYVVSVRHGSSISYAEVRSRTETTPHLLRKGPGFALYAVMDSIVDQYFPVIDALEHELQGIEEQVFSESSGRGTTEQIY
ncbi:MAG: CorA family divalent cation transporter, partial [Pyrinomonadaceae bacterium]